MNSLERWRVEIRKRTLDRLIWILLLLALTVLLLLAFTVWQYLHWQAPSDVPPQATDLSAEIHPQESALYRPYDATLLQADGSAVSLMDLRGHPVLLVFWSSWCPDCKDFLQNGVSAAFAKVREAGGEAFLVCREGRRGETWETALAVLAEMGVTEPTLMDPQAALYERMGLRWVPTAVLLDGQGRLMIATPRMPDEEEMQAMLSLLEMGHQAQTEIFLRDALLKPSGAVASSYKAQGAQVLPGQEVLSETQGLLMMYAVQAGDKVLFDQLLSYVRNEMTVAGLSAWIVSAGVPGEVNASLDDLRVLEALALAEERWGGYQQELAYRESALYRRTVKNGHMRDYAALQRNESAEAVTLCYLDVVAMERLGRSYEKWNAVADNARQVLAKGVISEDFPLFYPRYMPETDSYTGEYLQMNEALVAVCHAARAGIDCAPALDWLEQQMLSGGIFARYDMNGRPVRGYVYESTATYGLLAQAALHAGREELAQMALARLERNRCFTAPLAGDMGDVEDEIHYTFDLVQTLLAWQQWNTAPVQK